MPTTQEQRALRQPGDGQFRASATAAAKARPVKATTPAAKKTRPIAREREAAVEARRKARGGA